MSSGSQPHGRHISQANLPPSTPWKHLPVPPLYGVRTPQMAHMASAAVCDESMRIPPTWHTPTTEPQLMANTPPLFSLQQMINHNDRGNLGGNLGGPIPWRPHVAGSIHRISPHLQSSSPGPTSGASDLTVPARHVNGDMSKMSPSRNSPISLSVRDAKQINSLADRKQLPDLTHLQSKRPKLGLDSITERLNASPLSIVACQSSAVPLHPSPNNASVIVSHSSHDDSSNSNMSTGSVVATQLHSNDDRDADRAGGSLISHTALSLVRTSPSLLSMANTVTSTTSVISHSHSSGDTVDENASSPALSNDDSMDGKEKCRRRRKPNKTLRVLAPEESIESRLEEMHGTNEIMSKTHEQSVIVAAKMINNKPHEPIETDVNTSGNTRLDNETATTNNLQTNQSPQLNTAQHSQMETCENGTRDNLESTDMELETSAEMQNDTSENVSDGNSTALSASAPTDAIEDTLKSLHGDVEDVRNTSVIQKTFESSTPLRSIRSCRKSSDSETIENIKALIAGSENDPVPVHASNSIPAQINEINLESVLGSSESHNEANGSVKINETNELRNPGQYVEVENRLEKMFAGLKPVECTEKPALNTTANLKKVRKMKVGKDGEDSRKIVKDDKVKPRRNSKRLSDDQSVDLESSETNVQNASITLDLCSRQRQRNSSRSSDNDKPISSKSTILPRKQQRSSLPLPDDSIMKTGEKKTTKKVAVGAGVGAIEPATSDANKVAVAKLRGPFLQVRMTDQMQTVNVVNNICDDETDTKNACIRQQKPMKKFHDEQSSEFRNRIRARGLHSSTLSIRYDAHTKDATWICVFCKRGPHVGLNHDNISILPKLSSSPDEALAELNRHRTRLTYSSGDLFGPYYISSDCDEYRNSLDYINEYRAKMVERHERMRKKHQIATAEELYLSAHPNKFANKRAKRKPGEASASTIHKEFEELASFNEHSLDGMVPVHETGKFNEKFEIWSHEDCVIWSPGIFLSGLRLVGLEGAVWSCCAILCEYCARGGATVFCLVRACALVAHVPCALEHNWLLKNDEFKAYCEDHKGVEICEA